MKQKFLFFITFLIFFSRIVYSQEIDTVHVREILYLKDQIVELQKETIKLDNELQKMKNEVAEGMEFTKLIAILNEEEITVPEEQFSRRKRLDRLLKAMMDRPGQLRFNGSVTGIIQGKKWDSEKFSSGTGSFDIYAHTALGRNALLFIDFEAVGGNGPSKYISSISSLNADAGSTQDKEGFDHLNVLEAWAEFNAINDALHFTIGKIDLTNYFDNNLIANDETSQFISSCFVNSTALPIPTNTPGARIRTTIANRFFLQFGLCSIDNSGDNILNELFKIGSVGFRIFSNTNLEGNIRIYGYLHPEANNTSGYGLSFDKAFFQKFKVFMRWNKNSSELSNWHGISSALSFGSQFVSIIKGKRVVSGIAYGESIPSHRNLLKEVITESYVRVPFNKWVSISPHLQYIHNGGGISSNDVILGMRTQFEY